MLYGLVTLLGIAVWGAKGFALTLAVSCIGFPIFASFEPNERRPRDKTILFAPGILAASIAMGGLAAPERVTPFFLLAAMIIMFTMSDLYGLTKTKSVTR